VSPKRTCLLLSLEAVFVRFSVACFVVLPRGSGRLLLRVVHYLCKRVGIVFERDANLTFDVSRHITVRLIITHIHSHSLFVLLQTFSASLSPTFSGMFLVLSQV